MNLNFFLFLVFTTINCSSAASGGNCKNLCENAMKDMYFQNCLNEHSCIECQCVNCGNCTCSEECQECYDDVYNACGDCTDKNMYNFDKDVAPKIKERAERMNCSDATTLTTTILSFFVMIHFKIHWE
mgnify:CR=1 FL=1